MLNEDFVLMPFFCLEGGKTVLSFHCNKLILSILCSSCRKQFLSPTIFRGYVLVTHSLVLLHNFYIIFMSR